MALYPGLMLTEAGIQMIAESQLNETKLIITKAKIGDGDLPVGHDISKMTDVLSPKLEAPFSSFKNLGNGQIDIKFAVSNAELEAGFFAKEIGIFASLEDGTETLYAYTNAGNKTDWIADKTKPIDSQIIECQLVIGNAPNVVINITDKAYALAEDLAKHEESAESHKDLFDNKADKLENGHGIVRSVNNQYADDNGNVNLSGIDTGMIIPFAGNGDIPAGFLLCNGASVLRDTYPDLFKVIGTTYGAVDSTHFNLPNLIGRFAEGSESAGGYKEAGLPNITGEASIGALNGQMSTFSQTGAIAKRGEYQELFSAKDCPVSSGAAYWTGGINIDASRSSPIYGNSDTVQPPSLTVRYIIKAFAGASVSSTDIEITKVANDVADKANRDLSNLSENGRKAFFPSDTFIDITNKDSGATYTAPANGFVHVYGVTTNINNTYFELANNHISIHINTSGITIVGRGIGGYVPAKKGDKVVLNYAGMDIHQFRFIYAEGEV